MIWHDALIAYMALGMLTAIAGIIYKHFAKDGPSISAIIRENRARWLPKWQARLEYFRDEVLGQIFGVVLVVIFWPLLVVGWLANLWRHLRADKVKEKKFVLKREELVKLYELDEIESLERVKDPLGAVPNLPFGHLNAAWERFKKNILPNDEIWSFAAPFELWGRNGIRYGYVIFRDGQSGPFWVTDTRDVDGVNGDTVASRVGSSKTASSGASDVDQFDIPAFLRKHSN